MNSRHASTRAPPQALLAKYRALLHKHELLVRKLEARTVEHVSTWNLSSWGLETTASGLALLRGDMLQMANSRWHALSKGPGTWRPLDGEGTQPLRSLRQVAQQEALLVLGHTGAGPRVTRYQLSTGARTLELRAERLKSSQEPRVLILALDVSEQVRAEQELTRAREALAEREHLRALGEMSSGVVHDLSATLNAMRLRLELIQRDTPFAERQRGHLDALARIVSDANMRLSHLRDFARQRPEPTPGERVRLDDVVREAVDIARGDLEHRARQEGLEVKLDVELPPLPQVQGQASDLRYVLINLLLNARDAMPRGGTIQVRGRHEGGQVLLTVKDEGTGIPEQHLLSIFRPFFSTKGSQGTGLGLSMAYGVVSRAGGTITAANRPAGGACFTLAFPALPSPAPPPRPVRDERVPGRTKRRSR